MQTMPAPVETDKRGLSSKQAATQRARYGFNEVTPSRSRNLLVSLARRLLEPLVPILLLAAVISGGLRDWQSFGILLFIVLFSILLDIAQERKAEAAIEALRHSVASTVAVRRDGNAVELPVREIVPGDVVELRAGNLVPADGVVVAAHGALVDESVLTGESYPVEKRPPEDAGADDASLLFAGSGVIGGEAVMVVQTIGLQTRFGRIAAALGVREAPTAFMIGVHRLSILILRLTGFLVLFVLLTELVRHGVSLDGFMFAVALAVGLTPELMPMVMTVTLANGAMRMAKRKVVVKRLSAIHDLGAMTVLCTDKTGTLTQGSIAHVGSIAVDGTSSDRVAELVRRNALCGRGTGSVLDDAVIAAAPPANDGWHLRDDVPFDFERRRSSVLVADAERCELIVKGAPEQLLELCKWMERPDGSVIGIDPANRQALHRLLNEQGQAGFRILGVAHRAMPAGQTHVTAVDEAELTFVGFAAFLDPPKPTARDAVARLARAGVRVKIISGDAAAVVSHLAEILRLTPQGLLSGEEIDRLTDIQLAMRADGIDLFVRIDPNQKARIVRALRRAGQTVGFLGDGINDAPAIHAADVGLSVDHATGVAREAADIVLLAPDLAVVADGIAEGRRACANIMKYVRTAISSNFGNMLSMSAASAILPFLPLTAIQILVNNLIYDLSEVGIPADRADAEDVSRPQSWDMRAIVRFMLVMGPLSSLFDIAVFGFLWLVFKADVETFRTAWFVESITTQILVIFVVRTTRPVWASRPHPLLLASSFGALAAALVLALTPMGSFLGFVTVPVPILATLLSLTVAYLVAAEMLKHTAQRE